MSTRAESCHNFTVSKHERDGRLPCSTSHPSAYSHEAKANCNLGEGSSEEFADYSLISSRYKQKYPPQTTHGLSTSSIVPGKENRTPYSSRIEPIFDPSTNSVSFKSGNVQSRASAERGPNSPRVEEQVYSPTHYGCGSRKQSNQTDRVPKDACYISGSESSPSSYSKHSIQVYKNNMASSVQHHKAEKTTHSHQEVHKQLNRHTQPVLNTFQTQHALTGAPNNCHYQQPKIRPSVDSDQCHNPYRSQTHAQTEPEPPYPAPPRYSHQHHARRKTWSPPALKMSLLNSSPHESRVCCSNDSLDVCEEMGLERKTQSLSEDLDVSPPKLAPISGVLAQKPGSNVIRPIAFKPVQGNATGSNSGVRRQQESCDYSNGSRSSNPQAPKQNANLSGMQAGLYLNDGTSNIGAFNSMTKLQYHTTSGGTPRPLSSQPVSGHTSHLHPSTSHSHSTNLNNIHNNLQHSSSMNSQHLSNNTYINILAASSISTNQSSVLARDAGGFANDRQLTLHESQSIHSTNVPCVSSQVAESILQTPSPSDSGVGELEAMLREKDAEINTLREVMDRNERAIFQVYEERRNTWLHNTQELQNDYEHKLKVQNQKAMMTEQALSQQVCKLQKDVETLQEENGKIANERDMLKQQTDDNQKLISQLKISLEAVGESKSASSKDTNNVKLTEGSTDQNSKNNKDSQSIQEELALKNKELFILKSKLHSFQTDIDKKNKELAEKAKDVSTKTEELKTLTDELARHKDPLVLVHTSVQTHVPSEVATSENVKPSMLGEKDRAIHGLQEELTEIRAYIALLKEQHEKEREQWLDEKNKVVRYQKQLQLNYVQMQRKNVVLETEIQQLTLDLENRDMKLMTLTGDDDMS